eukprot:1703015-Pleurochrysis_carterae.AAC.1
MGASCIAAAGAGVLQLSNPGDRVGERGLRGWVVSRCSGRSTSLARPAAGVGGTEVFNLGVRESYRRVASSSFVSSKGERDDEYGTLREGEDSS